MPSKRQKCNSSEAEPQAIVVEQAVNPTTSMQKVEVN